jgi:Mlc titration factor MtfA (ptsG expression regulator)
MERSRAEAFGAGRGHRALSVLAKVQAAWRRWREDRACRRHAIPDALWQLTLARFPFLGWRSGDQVLRLRRLATLFLAQKEFSGAHGLVVTDEMAVAVAAQAVLPILNLDDGLNLYAGFVGIVMHGDAVVVPREVMDDDGVVHEYAEELAGEALQDGPVMLSWRDVESASDESTQADWAYNVTIHEFAHVIDMVDGGSDGTPPLADRGARQHWIEVMEAAYADFCMQVDAQQRTSIDPYAADSMAEFFAVSVETFYVQPRELLRAAPSVYRLFAEYFREDSVRYSAQ